MVNNFQDLLNQFQNSINEYQKNGEQSKANEMQRLGQYLYSNYSKINPKVINSPAVLDKLRVEIESHVGTFQSVDDKFDFTIKTGGELEIRKSGAIYKSNIDGRDTKDSSSISFGQLKENPNYISITSSQVRTTDGVSPNASEFDKSYVKSESDITYTKEVYTQEGLQIQGTTAHTLYKDTNNTTRVTNTNFIAENEPDYSTLNGYTPRNEYTKYDKMACATRGTYLGDEENIGMYTLEERTPSEPFNYKVDTSIEPVSFDSRGQYLDYEHKPEEIKMEPTAEKSYDELKKEAVDKFGGKNGWAQLLHASEYRAIPQALLDFAAIKSNISPVITNMAQKNVPQVMTDRIQENASTLNGNTRSFKSDDIRSIATTQRVNPIMSRLKKIKGQIMEFFGMKSKDNQEKTQR